MFSLKPISVVGLTAIFTVLISTLMNRNLPQNISCICEKEWQLVCDTFRNHVEQGLEKGGGFSVYFKGQLAMECVGGYADTDAEVQWTSNTVSQYFSSSKGVAAVVMAHLVDSGLLDYRKNVIEYWPEFASNGKAAITIEQLLSHQAGLAALDELFSFLEVKDDWGKIERISAQQMPLWEPGEGIGYHGVSLGFYQDALVRRIDTRHRSLSQYFEEEIAKPLDIDFFIGLPLHENYRCAKGYEFSLLAWDTLTATRYYPSIWAALTDGSSLINKVMENPREFSLDQNPGLLLNNPHYRAVPSPSTSGFGTAQSLARLFGKLVQKQGPTMTGDTQSGLLSKALVRKLNEPIASGWDKVLLMNLTYGPGTTLMTAPHGGYIFGAPGAGGQMAYADPQFELGWSYLTNHQSVHAIGDDPKYIKLTEAMYECANDVILLNKRNS